MALHALRLVEEKASADEKPEITFQAEPFHLVQQECPRLFRMHHREMGRARAGIPLDIDWQGLAQASAVGRLHFLTVRADDKLVGYVMTLIGPHNHYKSTPHGFINAAWLHPAYRKGWVGYRLLGENDFRLKRLGVVRVTVAEMLSFKNRNGKRLRTLFKRLGYDPIEVHWEKVL